MPLFDRAIAFTDLHLGKKNNSHIFNQDCLDYVQWLCEYAKKENIKTCLFLGDWHDNRASVNVATLNYSIRALEMLNSTFDVIHMIPGNHDEYYRDRRDYNSIAFANKFKNIELYNDITTIDGATFVPWLVGDEYKKMRKLKSDYVFGHFELPLFYMNTMVQMPETTEVKREDLGNCGKVFTGHFHKRQENKNIIYMGNTFPHDYNDTWDDERGLAVLEWGKDHEYVKWPDAPKYRTLKISQLLEGPDHYLKPKTYARITLDIDISYEEANFIRETFTEQYNLRDLSLIPSALEDHSQEINGEINFESVDTIVSSQLQLVDSKTYDTSLLMNIYRNL